MASTGEIVQPTIRVFGGMGVEGLDGPITIGGARQRLLLALLVVRPESVVSIDWLAEHLWADDERPEEPFPPLRTYVSRLRQSFPEAAKDWIETDTGGYRFSAPAEAVEHRRFESIRAQATRARGLEDPQTAVDLLDEALALWRGDPFRELEDFDWALADIEQLRLDRLEMLEERWEAALALGRHTQITGELAAFTAEHGLRDRAVRQHALALHRSGRTTEALRVIEAHRQTLAEQSGLDPSPGIVELEAALLAGDASLDVDKVGRPLRGYRLLEEIGIGAFSVVWRGVQPSVNREVAIKQIRSELASEPEFIRRFEAEAHLVARIEHPHVVPLIDFWRDPDSAYLVMRWLRGGTLERRLDDGPLTVAQTMDLVRQVGGALSSAHSNGVVHRDVKAANILFDDEGNAFLTDFGIALEVAESSGPEAALSPGSPAYASPEQIRQERLGPQADIFSLGVVLFECLSGSMPFPSSSSIDELVDLQLHAPYPMLAELSTDIPDSISDAVAKATAKDPGDRFATIDEFLDGLESDRPAAPVSVKAPSAILPNPYKGLRAFDHGDNERFFGRERLVKELVARLSGSRCLVVVGPSGSGKSSVVRAGLVPALRAGAVDGSADWFSTTMVPGTDPYESLEAALLRIAVNPAPTLVEQLRDGKRGILRSLRRCLGSDDDRVIVTIDQFEEVFTAASNENAREFLDALAVAVDDPTSPLRLIVTIRADYYDRPLEHPAFAPIVKASAVEVTPLAGDELERAIVEPARCVGVEFEPGLVARIAAETTGQPSPLPLLQYTLSELFERRTDHVLTMNGYDEIGGLSGALAARAEALYDEAGDPERESIRRVFGRMTNPGGESADLRRRVPLSDIGEDPSDAWVLEQFGAARLISFDRDVATREPTVEVAHEALLREWPRLVSWLEEDSDILRSAAAAGTAADAWQEGGREGTDLYRGGRLENAVGLALAAPDRLRPLDAEFIDASRTAAEASRVTEEKRIRRLRRLVVGVGAALIVALIAGGLALRQSNRADSEAERAKESADDAEAQTLVAENQTRLAESQTEAAIESAAKADLATIISSSAAQTAENPEVALLLALEAHRRSAGPESEQAILNALGSSSLLNRVSTLDPLSDPSGSCPDTFTNSDGTAEFGVSDGKLVSRDPLTGVVTEHGASPAACVQWLGDEEANRRVAIAEDGLRVWIGPYDGPWELEREFGRPTFLVSRSFNSSNRLILKAGQVHTGGMALIDETTGETTNVPIADSHGLVDAVASADGSLIALAAFVGQEDSGVTVIIDGETGQELSRTDSRVPADALVIDDQTGELIAASSDRGVIRTIDLATGAMVSEVETGTTSFFGEGGVGIRPDGLIVAVSQSQIELVDRRTGPTGRTFDLRDVVASRVRPDGTVLTITSDGGSAIVDLDRNVLVERSWPVEPFAQVEINAGRAAAVRHPVGDPEIIDLTTGARASVQLITPRGDHVRPLVALPDADGIWTVDTVSQDAMRWEGEQLVEAFSIGQAHDGNRQGDVWAIILSDGLTIGYEVVQLLNIGSDAPGAILNFPAPFAASVHPTLDGGVHVLATDGTLRTYDSAGVQTGEIATSAAQDAAENRRAIATRLSTLDPASGKLAMGTGTGGALIVDPATGDIETVPGIDSVVSLGFVRGGELLAIVTGDGTVRLWDVERGASAGLVWDGSGAVAGGPPWYDEATETVWVATSGQLIQIPVNPQRWVEKACEVIGRGFTQDEWDRFVPGDEPLQSACG